MNILYERYQDWVVLVHGVRPPLDEEWSQYIGSLLEADAQGAIGVLVLTEGEGPNATQRKMISGMRMRSAVVTPSRVARGMVTALGWIGVAIKPFSPEMIDDAFRYLDIPSGEWATIYQRLAAMRLELAAQDPLGASRMSEAELRGVIGRPFSNFSASP